MRKYLIIWLFCCSFFAFGQRPNPSYEHKTITGDETVVFTFKVKPPVIARNLRIRDQSTSSGVKSINHNFKVNTNDEVTVNISIQLSNNVNEGNYYFEIDFTGDYQQHYYEHYGCKITREEQPVDSDGDGVPDSEDNCPNERGPVSNNGCPSSSQNDYDKDRVVDWEDKCPTQYGYPDYEGCPYRDNAIYGQPDKVIGVCKQLEIKENVSNDDHYLDLFKAGERIILSSGAIGKGDLSFYIDPDLCDYSPIPTQSARIVNVEEVTVESQPKVEEQQESTVQPTKESTIVIAPNPVTNGQFTLKLNLGQSSDVQITIYNFTGNRVQHVSSKFYGRGQHTIPIKVNRLRSGQYIVKVTTAEGVLSKHLIIK